MAGGRKGRHARSHPEPERSGDSGGGRRPNGEPTRRRPRLVRAPAARNYRPGTLRAAGDGTVLRCLVLVPGPEWVAVDLDSGALLRAASGFTPEQQAEPWEASQTGGATHDENARPNWPERSLSAVELTLAGDNEPGDPARPEAAVLAGRARSIGYMRKRTVRRLLQHVVTKPGDRPLLGTLGPSIAYSDLDGTKPSVVIIAPDGRPRFAAGPNGPVCQFLLGGRRHTMPCAEGASPDPSLTGHATKLLVVALGSPWRGQVPKVVLGALPLRS